MSNQLRRALKCSALVIASMGVTAAVTTPATPAHAAPTCPTSLDTTYTYNTGTELHCTLPAGVSAIDMEAVGPGGSGSAGKVVRILGERIGGGAGGAGAHVKCTVSSLLPHLRLNLKVGPGVASDGNGLGRRSTATQVLVETASGETRNLLTAEPGFGTRGVAGGAGGPVGSSSNPAAKGSCQLSTLKSAKPGGRGGNGQVEISRKASTTAGGAGGLAAAPVPAQCVNPRTGIASGTGGKGGDVTVTSDGHFTTQPGGTSQPGCLQIRLNR